MPNPLPISAVNHVGVLTGRVAESTAFYRDVLGFAVTIYGPAFGMQAVFLAAGDYHHHIALNTWMSADGTPPPAGHTGLHHFAIVYPNAQELGCAVQRLFDHEYSIDGAEDHGGTISVYLHDPDGNGIELYFDRPREEWFDAAGNPNLKAEPFDPRELLAAAEAIC